jgi:nucleoside phosphorylase
VALCCGIGPVEAAVATSRALAERQFSAVLQVGIAGAVTLEPGTVVLGSESVYSDVLDPNATSPRVARLAPDAALLARARAAMPDAPDA